MSRPYPFKWRNFFRSYRLWQAPPLLATEIATTSLAVHVETGVRLYLEDLLDDKKQGSKPTKPSYPHPTSHTNIYHTCINFLFICCLFFCFVLWQTFLCGRYNGRKADIKDILLLSLFLLFIAGCFWRCLINLAYKYV